MIPVAQPAQTMKVRSANPSFPVFMKRHDAISGLAKDSACIRLGGKIVVASPSYNKLRVYDPKTGGVVETAALAAGFKFCGRNFTRVGDDKALFFILRATPYDYGEGDTGTTYDMYLYEFTLSTLALRSVFPFSQQLNTDPSVSAWLAYSTIGLRVGFGNSQSYDATSMNPITINPVAAAPSIGRSYPSCAFDGISTIYMFAYSALYKRAVGTWATETTLALPTTNLLPGETSMSWLGNGKVLAWCNNKVILYDLLANIWTAVSMVNYKAYGQGDWDGETLLLPTSDGYLTEFTLEGNPNQLEWWR